MHACIRKIPLFAWTPIVIWATILATLVPVSLFAQSCGGLCFSWLGLGFVMFFASPLFIPYAVLIARETDAEFSVEALQSYPNKEKGPPDNVVLFYVDKKGKMHQMSFRRAEIRSQGVVRIIAGTLNYASVRFDSSDQAEDFISKLYPNDGKNLDVLEARASVFQFLSVTIVLIIPLIAIIVLIVKSGPRAPGTFPIIGALSIFIVAEVMFYIFSYLKSGSTNFLFKVVGNQIIANVIEERDKKSMFSRLFRVYQSYTFDISSIRISNSGAVFLSSYGSKLKVSGSKDPYYKTWFSEAKALES